MFRLLLVLLFVPCIASAQTNFNAYDNDTSIDDAAEFLIYDSAQAPTGMRNITWSAIKDLLVPYTGATTDVDLGNNTLTAEGATFDKGGLVNTVVNINGSTDFALIATATDTFKLRDQTSGADRIIVDGSGNVGIGTTGPDAKLDVLSTAGAQSRLTYTDGSVYTDFETDSSGYLNVTPSGNIVTVDGDINPLANNTYDLGIEQNYEWANVYARRFSGNNNRVVLELSGNSPIFRDHTSVGTGVLIQHRGTTVAKFGDGSGNAYMGVGTTAPARKVEILDTAGPQQRLTYTASSVYTDIQTTSNGYYHIQPTGGKTLFSGNKTLTSNARWYYINAGTNGSAQITSSGTGQSSPVGFITAELTYADGGSGETYSNARGINFIAAMNSDSASNSYYAGYFSARTKVDGQALTARGVTGEFIMDNSSGTPTVTTGIGMDAYVGNNYASGTITNAYGIRVRDVANAGTITNTYGVHVGDLTAGTQTNTPFSFYASDANAYNYFAGRVGIGTTAPSQLLDINDDSVRIRTAKTPSSASDTGTQGQIAWDADYIYICTATDTWKRVAISTW